MKLNHLLYKVNNILINKINIIVIFILLISFFFFQLLKPPPRLYSTVEDDQTKFYDRHGTVLRELLGKDQNRLDSLSFEESLPINVINALLAAEDHRFYDHVGIDPYGIFRAFIFNLKNSKHRQGGSTLSQQLASILIKSDNSYFGKIVESFTALNIEFYYKKSEIIISYLNHVSFANQIIGLKRAAKIYLNKDIVYLSPAESAFLIGVVAAPSRYNPWRYKKTLTLRKERILQREKKLQYISDEDYREALLEKIDILKQYPSFYAPHFIDFFQNSHMTTNVHTKIFVTSIDLELQTTVKQIIVNQMQYLRDNNVHSGSAIIIDNKSGDILSWCGSPKYFDKENSGQIDGVSILRQPGSSLKPFTYLLALERGVSTATVLPDVPLSFNTESGVFEPKNYSGQYQGPIRVREALANSLNIPAIYILNKIRSETLLNNLKVMGFDHLEESASYYGLGLTLGNAEVKLFKLANGYRTIANNGDYSDLNFIVNGELKNEKKIYSYGAVQLIKSILSDNSARTLSFGKNNIFNTPYPLAVKTGTSQGFRDNIAVGFCDQYTVAVWVGNFDRQPMRHVSGITGAGPILRFIFDELNLKTKLTLTIDDSVLKKIEICPLSGLSVGEDCGGSISEYFLRDSALPPVCHWHQNGIVKLPIEYQKWIDSINDIKDPRLKLFTGRLQIRILSPLQNGTYYFDSHSPISSRGLSVESYYENKSGKMKYYLNEKLVKIKQYPYKFVTLLKQGHYTLQARHTDGSVSRPVRFKIK